MAAHDDGSTRFPRAPRVLAGAARPTPVPILPLLQRGVGESEDRPGRPTLAQSGQRRPGRFASRHHHGGHRCPCGRLEGVLPAFVDLDQVEERPHHAVHAGQQFGAGRPPASSNAFSKASARATDRWNSCSA